MKQVNKTKLSKCKTEDTGHIRQVRQYLNIDYIMNKEMLYIVDNPSGMSLIKYK